MYTTKRYNDKVEAFGGKFPTLASGEKYQDVKNPLPTRWKGKQLETQFPKKYSAIQDGTFDNLALQRLHIASGKKARDLYVPACDPRRREVKRDVYDDSFRGKSKGVRKNGFGTSAMNQRDEFTDQIRTERYRERLKSEMKHTDRAIGRSSSSAAFNSSIDNKNEPTRPASACLWKTTTADIGRGVEQVPNKKPEYGINSSVKQFYDIGHL